MKHKARGDADKVWKRKEIDSPCVSICVMHPTERICTGCYRTIEEISGWSAMSSEERQTISEELPDRTPRLRKRQGGSSARLRSRN